MEILQDKWKRGLTFIVAIIALADGAGGRIKKKSPVVSLSIVVAGDPESQRPNQNQQRRRERPPAMMRVNERRIKGRKVRPPFEVFPFEGAQSGIDSECTEQNNDGQQLKPPRIPPHRAAEMALSRCG